MDILLPIILSILNKSLNTGSVPKCFKSAVVKPALKKQDLDPSICKNFRPVSNLSFISKLLEKVVADQLMRHLVAFDCLDKFQSAYRPHFSTETALLRAINDILCNINSGKLVLLIHLDLSAAFDTINHSLLLNRLSLEAGIGGTVLQWISSYLTDRTQKVIVGASFSEDKTLTCGVPQGSVLGPLLFSVYTSQLGKVIEQSGVDRHFYADDSQLYCSFPPDPLSAKSALERLEACCSAVKIWMTRNRLKLNDEKTEALLCGTKTKRKVVGISSVQVGDASIAFKDSVRDLGLIIDSDLSMREHIKTVVRNCFFQLRLLGRLRPLLNQSAANTVALATVMSRVDYCNSVLWGLPDTLVNKLQRLQNIAAGIVTRTRPTDHITTQFYTHCTGSQLNNALTTKLCLLPISA